MVGTPGRQASRLARSAVACQRCRRRKQKCDLAYPQCSNCEAAQAECLSYHVGKKQEIPRNYFENLEAQVEGLKKEVEELRSRSRVPASVSDAHAAGPMSIPTENSQGSTDQSKRYEHEVVKSLALVVLEPSDQPRFLGTSSGFALAKVVMASVGCNWPHTATPSRNQTLKVCSTEIKSSLPPPQAAAHLIDVYFQCRTPHFPILERAEILSAVQTAYLVAGDNPAAVSRAARRDLFVAFMVFAISLCGLQIGSGDRPFDSEGCYHSAIQYLDSAISYSDSDTETLSSILLLAQYISLSPSKGSLWILAGLALRISINIGLHWETDAALRLDCAQRNKRKRLFWATYHLDRLLVVTLGRPFSLEEQSIDVGFPDTISTVDAPVDAHSQFVVNHLILLARLESEIKHVLYRHQKEASIAFPRPNYSLWIKDIKPRLEEWRVSIPAVQNAHPESIYAFGSWWEAMYSNTLMLLHRPNPVVPEPSPESLQICFDASTNLIKCARALQRDHRLEMAWLWAQRLFVAGLTLIYAAWNSDEIRRAHAPDDIVNTAQTCATTLAVLTERFPSAAGCRDALETLVSATVRALFAPDKMNPACSKTAAEPRTESAVSKAESFQPGLGISLDGMYSMLSEDLFGISQGIASAPGWSGLPDDVFDFGEHQDIGASAEWSVSGNSGDTFTGFM